MSEIVRELNDKIEDLKQLETANGFNIAIESGCLRHSSIVDMGDRANVRMGWVYKALNTSEVKTLILKKAAELCKEDIDADMNELVEIIVANKALVMSMGGLIQNPPEHILTSGQAESIGPIREPEKAKPKHAGGRPRKVKTEPMVDNQSKKKRGRPRKVVEVSPLTVGEEAKAPSRKQAKIADSSVELKNQEQSETVLSPTYHEPCKTCRKSRRDASGNYPPCKDGILKTGTSGIETCELWWERR